ncbi:hypothetical protein [Streptomonospora litoralis]|uniref:2-keto-4-pentenoate hydratase n=1 Tax=Streptomonospora litoralis TaxID=2498135 RepID=A0A4P6Q7Z9_9ACTN|nr:hypothetical protein [Streptomonospora litoralis]QBI55134.1 hypothetical protein EKD16_16825 [Streptomonospora litoralis]
MRWVTYLSPSGGEERSGVVDDGCVFGYPGAQSVPELLEKDRDALADAYHKALAAPVEIIVEFETRLCAPVRPERSVPAHVDGAWTQVAPALVRGTDDGVLLPAGVSALTAAVGVMALFGGQGRHAGYTPACLWRTLEGDPVTLSVGPAIVTHDEFDGSPLCVEAGVEGRTLARAELDGGLGWAAGTDSGFTAAALPAGTRPLEPGEELFVDGGRLGEFEMRVGAGA